MKLKTRQVEIAGVTESPNADWITPIARNLTACEDGHLSMATYLIVDRDTKFVPLRTYMEEMTETKIVLLPARSPNLNAYLERFMRSLKSECLNRMIFCGRASLERSLTEFAVHYHGERNHQGLGNRVIAPGGEFGQEIGEVQCRERLGGLLRYYYRDAA
jgi:putative transposase